MTTPSSANSVWSRATGKSSKIAWLIHRIVTEMPRSCWGIVGSTYQQILTRTLPSTIASLERIGYYKDVHYFIGRKPPPSWGWPEPFQRPVKYDNFIIFYTGAGFHLITQDGGGGSSRGMNLDGYIADEALLLNREKLGTDVIASNRGNVDYWPKATLHHGKFLFSSMPWGDTGKWLLDDAAYYAEDGYDFQKIRDAMIALQLQFVDTRSQKKRLDLYAEIRQLSSQLRFYPNPKRIGKGHLSIPKGLLYSEANIFDNLQNVGIGYLEDQRRELSDFVFMIEILNKRPATVEAGFYPKLDVAHHAQECPNNDYVAGLEFNLRKLGAHDSRMDGDCRSHQPIRGAVDWGSKISTLTLAQIHADVREYRFLKGLYVKHPKLIDDLADLFIRYYQHHLVKVFEFIQDNEWGNARRPDSSLTYNQQFAERLKAAGWRVRVFDQGRVPDYGERYRLAYELLGETDERQLRIRFNKVNCKDPLTAMSLAPVKQGTRGEIQKDKSSERKLTLPGQEATHFTDIIDLHFLSIDKHVARSTGQGGGLLLVSA
ncbi:hypothetical protein [Hymenobacter rubidus]|uniref:hypothetical protein n=1 Tax=Hymenobacter rubidus TaxID=1441626 RepID=UPI00191F42A2|nr:hypothetical protein [Hymenobacter rubidus]